jgi:hypothetical protein
VADIPSGLDLNAPQETKLKAPPITRLESVGLQEDAYVTIVLVGLRRGRLEPCETIRPKVLRNSTKTFIQYSLYLDRDSNRLLPKYKSRALPLSKTAESQVIIIIIIIIITVPELVVSTPMAVKTSTGHEPEPHNIFPLDSRC